MQNTAVKVAGLALLLAGMSACKKDAPEREVNPAPVTARPDVLKDVPIIATSRQIDTTGSSDAERSTWTINSPLQQVAAYYRHILPPLGWSIMNDLADSTQGDIYLRQAKVALWVHLERKDSLTVYTLITSAADSTTAPPAAAAPHP
jgi:hypothetical protein